MNIKTEEVMQMAGEKEGKEERWIPAHKRAIELLEMNPDEHCRTLGYLYNWAKVPEEDREDLLEAFPNATIFVPTRLVRWEGFPELERSEEELKRLEEESKPAHERAIELLKWDPDTNWQTLRAMYQKAKVPEEAQEDLLKAFKQNAPAVPAGLKKQIEESEEE